VPTLGVFAFDHSMSGSESKTAKNGSASKGWPPVTT